MNSLIHADIFFYVATISLILFTIAGLIILIVYVIPILRNFREITDSTNQEAKRLLDDIRQMRLKIKENSFTLGDIIAFSKRFFRSMKNIKNHKNTNV